MGLKTATGKSKTIPSNQIKPKDQVHLPNKPQKSLKKKTASKF